MITQSFLDISRSLNEQPLLTVNHEVDNLPLDEIPGLIAQLTEKMTTSAKQLEFEQAAQYRDQIHKLRQQLLG